MTYLLLYLAIAAVALGFMYHIALEPPPTPFSTLLTAALFWPLSLCLLAGLLCYRALGGSGPRP